MAETSYCASVELRSDEKWAAETSAAQLHAEIAKLRERIAGLDARAPTEMVEKVMARACFRASEELRRQEHVVAEAAIAQLQTELGQLQRDKGDHDERLQQVRCTVLHLTQKLKVSTEECQLLQVEVCKHIHENAATKVELQALKAKYDALCQEYQHLHAQCCRDVNMQREANAARLAEVEKKLHAAVREAEMTRELMDARLQIMVEDAERAEEESQQREKELKKQIDMQALEMIELDMELKSKREAVKDLEGDREYFLRQLDARLLQSSRLQVRSLTDCPFIVALGVGGQATVDLHEMDGIRVAVKKPADDEDQHSLLLEEEALRSLCHRAIPRPLAWLTMDDGNRALAIEEYSGGLLHDMLRPEEGSGRTPMRPSMEWGMARIAEGAEALQYVHSIGRVHQDIKPRNLMLDAEGKLVIIDWGSSFLTSETPHTWRGTPGYLRPLTAAFPERAGPEDDIRGLCAVGLELATGESVPYLLDTQYKEVQKDEKTEETIEHCCSKHGLCCYFPDDCVIMAEYLGLIAIKEENFHSYINQEGAPREYLRLLLRALSQPVGCGEAPMPTLQEIRNAIGSYLSRRA